MNVKQVMDSLCN